MHKIPKALTFIGALLALTFCAVSCKTEDDDDPTMYTVTVSSSIEHGKVTADKSSAEAGAKVKLTATADSGYELDSYSVKDEKSNTIPVTEGTFTMPKSNVTVSATFKETAETVNKNAANAVIAKITTIGTVAYTDESKEKIDDARKAYDALNEAQKALVPEETLNLLTAAETAYAELKAAAASETANQNAANAVIAKITAIGTVTYTSESKAKIEEARKAYEDLTEAQKALVPAETLSVLTAAESKYSELKAAADSETANKNAADAVIAKITAIGTVAYSDESKAKIDDARKAYDALTEAQKKLVPAETLSVLTAAEASYNSQKATADAETVNKTAADAVIAKITAIGTVAYTEASKALIEAARNAYDALTEAQKALIPAETLAVLTKAETDYNALKTSADEAAANQAAADAVIAKINAIGTVAYTDASKVLIAAARTAYDALTSDQKALVTNYSTLTTAESSYESLAPVRVTAITLNKTATEIKVGSTETLSVTAVAPENATDKTYTWKTSDATKATVTAEGVVTAVAKGTVTIYAEANDGSGVKGNCTVTVAPATITVTAITLNKTATEIKVGSTETLSVTAVAPENATDKTYTWKTSDATKATVTAEGVVTAVAEGTVTIYAEANDGSGVKGNCTVTVAPATITVTAITLNKTATEIKVGSTETLSVTAVAPENATDKTYTWKTSDATKATVTAEGVVTAVAEGTVTIYAEANDGSGVKGNCTVTVTPATITATITVTINQSDWAGWNPSFTKDGVTVSAGMIDPNDGNIMDGGTFSTTLGNFTKIVVTTQDSYASGTGWSGSGSTKTWAGTPASTVSFSGDFMGMGMTQTTIVCTIVPTN